MTWQKQKKPPESIITSILSPLITDKTESVVAVHMSCKPKYTLCTSIYNTCTSGQAIRNKRSYFKTCNKMLYIYLFGKKKHILSLT